jgi:four helix bundle protein
MPVIRSFRDLEVYKLAFASAMEIYRLSKTFPSEERYSLTDQIRRSSRSVCSNTGEGWRKRRYPAAFVNKLSDADGEAAETQVWLDFALGCGHMAKEKHNELDDKYDHICAQLRKMMENPEQWCGGTER